MSEKLRKAAMALVEAHDKHRKGGANYPAFWIHDQMSALRRALAEEETEALPDGFPYTVPGEEYARGWRDGIEAAAVECEESNDKWPDMDILAGAIRELVSDPHAPEEGKP